ncbi:hypothetical protein AAHE18_17G150300 [Arachis hypogaea]
MMMRDFSMCMLVILLHNWTVLIIRTLLLRKRIIIINMMRQYLEILTHEPVAQFGVIFLLFALGLEFSTTKLRVVQAVAILGSLLQIFLFMCLCE